MKQSPESWLPGLAAQFSEPRAAWEKIPLEDCLIEDVAVISPDQLMAHHISAFNKTLRVALNKVALNKIASKVQESIRLDQLEIEVSNLRKRVEELETLGSRSVIFPITSFEPEPFEAISEITAVVLPSGENGYVASFLDANINASGDTVYEAVQNLKDSLVDLYVDLKKFSPERLGPLPRKQIQILEMYIREKEVLVEA